MVEILNISFATSFTSLRPSKSYVFFFKMCNVEKMNSNFQEFLAEMIIFLMNVLVRVNTHFYQFTNAKCECIHLKSAFRLTSNALSPYNRIK